MIRIYRSVLVFSALALGVGLGSTAQAQIAYAIGDNTTLLSFDLANPGVVTTIGNLSGAVSFLDDIDFRLSDGLLYGYRQGNNTLVTVSTTTGVTTFLNNPTIPLSSGGGIDFDPVTDLLRMVDGTDQNRRLNVSTGSSIKDSNLNYPSAADPLIANVAYTNNDSDTATGTTAYFIDSHEGTLATSIAPNSGVLTTVGSLGVVPGSQSGFDIFTGAGGVNRAYAVFGFANNPALYNIDLATGVATLVGSVGTPIGRLGKSDVTGLAIRPGIGSPVPEPGSVALLAGLTMVGAGFLRKRRRRL